MRGITCPEHGCEMKFGSPLEQGYDYTIDEYICPETAHEYGNGRYDVEQSSDKQQWYISVKPAPTEV